MARVLKWMAYIVLLAVMVLAAMTYWMLISGSSAPKAAAGVFDMTDWRIQADRLDGDLPTEVRILEVGSDIVPSFIVQAGDFHGDTAMSYNAVEIVFPDYSIMIGGAIDQPTSEVMRQSETEGLFDPAAYQQLTDALANANKVLITHEHPDHVIAVARHPEPGALAPRLLLNQPQIASLPTYAGGELAPALKTVQPGLSGSVEAIAPGVVVVPAAGHSPGSQMVFIALENGEEVLLLGDIVWVMSNLDDLKTRPILTQYLVFDHGEDRASVKRQVRALHDLRAAEPDLIMVPAHDRNHLLKLAEDSKVGWGLAPPRITEPADASALAEMIDIPD